ncbi:hypothetical protein SAMN04489730_7008 [Amycolatopsis australiensis]|uniref:Uncharacterized protein n=1 Tax=Amycolatopsis australiensis TaxID=546364 RepID=A0A1K1SWI4_9PSEU|nr:hypothetical protein SAMN04489730_7008 [Amycolatopsis australiensis]
MTITYQLPYTFTGFQSPVQNLPATNVAKAGQAIPIKFSLGGDQGLDILAAGSPTFSYDSCTTQLNDVTADTASNSGLSYDATTDTYTYVWKTNKAWAGDCGTFHLQLNDGTDHTAVFQFR